MADDPAGTQVPVTLERIVEVTDVPVPRVMEETVGVGRLTFQLPEGESTLLTDNELSSQLDGGCAAQAPEWEELRRLSDEELVTIRDTNKLLNDSDELTPKWFDVVKGVVALEDLPLNVYRETLLHHKILRVIKKNYVTKYLEMLAEFAETEDFYNKLYEQFGMCLKHGIHEDSIIQLPKDMEASKGHTSPYACTLEIAELNDDRKKFYERFVKYMKLGICENSVDDVETLRFNTFKPGDEQFSFEEYVDCMKEGQNDIYYLTGESIAAVSSRKKGHEVIQAMQRDSSKAVASNNCKQHNKRERKKERKRRGRKRMK